MNFHNGLPGVAWVAVLLAGGAAFQSAPGTPLPADEPQESAKQVQAKDLYPLDIESLLDVRVTTASKFSEKLSDAAGVLSVVSKDELRRFSGLTLGEILNRVAGLTASVASFTDRSLVAARGDQSKINGAHILFLINGRPTREVLEGLIGDLLEAFPVNILERIEVIKGPGSVLYGSNAFSAVVNLITQQAQGTAIVATALGGAGGATATSGQAMFRRGDLSIVAAGQFHQKPDWNTPFISFFGPQTIDVPNRAKGAFVELDYRGLRLMSSYDDWTTAYTARSAGIGRWRRAFADLGYGLKAAPGWDMNFNLTFTRSTLDAQNYAPNLTRDAYELVAEWGNVIRLTPKDQLAFGALTTHIQGTEVSFLGDRGTVTADGTQQEQAFYAQLGHELNNSWKVVAGIQANRNGNIKLNVVPRVGIIWNPTSNWAVKALYSQAFRAPSINEMFLHFVPPPEMAAPSLSGNPKLLPEKVATTDIGLSYQRTRFHGAIDYFRSQQTNSIVMEGLPTGLTYTNLGGVTFQGVEMEGKYYFKKSLFVTGSAMYQTNEDEHGRGNVAPIANLGAKAGISYLADKHLSVSLFDVYQGHIQGYSQALNPKPGAYHLLNSHFSYDLSRFMPANARTGMSFVIHGDNLTNKQLWLPDWNDAPGDSTFVNRGRTVYFGLEFSLRDDR